MPKKLPQPAWWWSTIVIQNLILQKDFKSKLRRYFPRVSRLNFWFFIQGTFCFLCASELLLQGTIILGPRFSISAVSVVKLQPAEMFSSVVQTSQLQNLQTLFYRTFRNYMRNMLQFLWPTILPALHLQLRTVWSWRMGTWFFSNKVAGNVCNVFIIVAVRIGKRTLLELVGSKFKYISLGFSRCIGCKPFCLIIKWPNRPQNDHCSLCSPCNTMMKNENHW